MIILTHPANIDGTIKPAGSPVTGLSIEMEQKYIDAGTAEYPKSAAHETPTMGKAEAMFAGLVAMTNAELDAMGAEMGLDMSQYRVKIDKVGAIEVELARIAAEKQGDAQKTSEDAGTDELESLSDGELDQVGTDIGLDMSAYPNRDEKLIAIVAELAKREAEKTSGSPAGQSFGRPSQVQGN